MGDKRRLAVFDDFSGGEFGAVGAWRAPKNSFTGQNVLVYLDGSIGPRNGLKQYTLTGGANGVVYGIGFLSASSEDIVWVVVGSAVRRFDAGIDVSQAITTIGTFTGAPTRPVGSAQWNEYAVIATDSGLYRVDNVSVVDTTGPHDMRSVVRLGERLLVSGLGVALNGIVYFSEAANISSWPAANYFMTGAVRALVRIRDALAIATTSIHYTPPQESTWRLLTGVPGVNETLREVVAAMIPLFPDAAVLLGDGAIGCVIAAANGPGFFNGSFVDQLRHLAFAEGHQQADITPPAYRAVLLRDENDWMAVGDSASQVEAFVYRDRTWTRHLFSEAPVRSWAASSRSTGKVVFATAGASGAAPAFYRWNAYADRPPFTSDAGVSILTPSACSFALPDMLAERGEQVSVRKVTVWFRDWNTGDSNVNQFNVKVTPIRQYESGEGTTQTGVDAAGVTPSFSRLPSASSTSGASLRREWNFAADWGDAARLQFSDLRGVAIHRVEVDLDTKADAA